MAKHEWKRVAPGEYVDQFGNRVYQYARKAFQAEWGVQLTRWSTGDGGHRSMRAARAFVEKYAG